MMLFTDVLRFIRKGKVVDLATAKMAELVAKVEETGQPGSLTLKLSVSTKKGADGQIVIAPSLKVSLPDDPLSDAIFYVDADGGLTRNDPDQREMFGETERAAPQAVREA